MQKQPNPTVRKHVIVPISELDQV